MRRVNSAKSAALPGRRFTRRRCRRYNVSATGASDDTELLPPGSGRDPLRAVWPDERFIALCALRSAARLLRPHCKKRNGPEEVGLERLRRLVRLARIVPEPTRIRRAVRAARRLRSTRADG